MVSVIIPSYNRATTIEKSILSVLNQTYADLELIVVDDGSTDNTEDIVKEMKDSRLRYIKQLSNQGACAARNRGIEEAKGNYIAFQDSDDIWAEDKLEKQIRFLEAQKADMIYCGMTRNIGKKTRYFPSDQRRGQELSLKSLLAKNKISTQTILVKKDVAEKIRFDISFKRLQDWDFSIRVLLGGYKVLYLAESLVTAEVQKDSITTNVNTIEAYRHFINKYHEYYSQYPSALGSVYYTVASGLSNSNPQLAKKYLRMSLKLRFRIKTLVKYIGSI